MEKTPAKEIALRTLLVRTARSSQLLPYVQAAQLVGLPAHRTPFIKLVESVSLWSFETHGVILGALLVSKYEGVPPSTFFTYLKTIKDIDVDTDHYFVWASLVRRCHLAFGEGEELRPWSECQSKLEWRLAADRSDAADEEET